MIEQKFEELDVVLLGYTTQEGGASLTDDDAAEAVRALLLAVLDVIPEYLVPVDNKVHIDPKNELRARINTLKAIRLPDRGQLPLAAVQEETQ